MTLLAPAAHRRVRWLALCAYADADGAVVEIAHDAQGRFTGRLHTEQGTFALSGYAADDQGGEGVIEAVPDRIPFDVALRGDGVTLTLVLRDNGAQYTFQRQARGASVGGSHQGTEQPPTEARPSTATTDPYLGSYRELAEPVPRAHQVPPSVFASAHQVPRGLLGLAGDRDRHDLVESQQFGDVQCVAGVGFHALTHGSLQLRGREHLAAHATRPERSGEREPGRAGPVRRRDRIRQASHPGEDLCGARAESAPHEFTRFRVEAAPTTA